MTKKLIGEEDIEHDIHVKMKPVSKKTFHSINEVNDYFFPKSSKENKIKYPITINVSQDEYDAIMYDRGIPIYKKKKE